MIATYLVYSKVANLNCDLNNFVNNGVGYLSNWLLNDYFTECFFYVWT